MLRMLNFGFYRLTNYFRTFVLDKLLTYEIG